jgi:hypothetical protein
MAHRQLFNICGQIPLPATPKPTPDHTTKPTILYRVIYQHFTTIVVFFIKEITYTFVLYCIYTVPALPNT